MGLSRERLNSRFRRRPGFGLSRPQIDFTRNRGQPHHGPSWAFTGEAAPVKPPALTLLWSYWAARACFQLLELAAILPRRGEPVGAVALQTGGGLNRHDVDIAVTTARAEARPCGGARRRCRRSCGVLRPYHGRRSPPARAPRPAPPPPAPPRHPPPPSP